DSWVDLGETPQLASNWFVSDDGKLFILAGTNGILISSKDGGNAGTSAGSVAKGVGGEGGAAADARPGGAEAAVAASVWAVGMRDTEAMRSRRRLYA
ncbi:MAG: hypothetical protein ABI533_07295, partial [Betaproteobacteria bacterium]